MFLPCLLYTYLFRPSKDDVQFIITAYIVFEESSILDFSLFIT